MKKILPRYMGDFRTKKTYYSPSQYDFYPSSGWATHIVNGKKESLDVVTSIPLQMNSENYFAAQLATMIINDAVSSSISQEQIYLESSFEYDVFPHDRYSLILSVNPLSKSALSYDEASAISSSFLIRTALDDVTSKPINANLLNVYKKQLIVNYASKQQNPLYWLNAISAKYSDAKDLNSSYSQKINSISVEKVKSIIEELDKGSKLEYIVTVEN